MAVRIVLLFRSRGETNDYLDINGRTALEGMPSIIAKACVRRSQVLEQQIIFLTANSRDLSSPVDSLVTHRMQAASYASASDLAQHVECGI